MKMKSQKGSITIFVLIALLFYTAFLLLLYAANTNKLIAIKEKSDILKEVYGKNISDENIDNLYKKSSRVEILDDNILYKADRLELTGTNYINTGIELFSEENIDKDFEISFEIVKGYIKYVKNGTFFSLLNHENPTTQGVSLYSSDGLYTVYSKFNTDYSYWYDYDKLVNTSEENPFRFKLRRIGNVLLLTINDNEEKEILDYTKSKSTFNTPLIFGGKMNSNGEIVDINWGILRNVEVKYINVTNYKEIKRTNYYKLDGQIKFDGTKYLDTGIKLFSEENKNKNFEISFDIIANQDAINDNTLLECRNRNSGSLTGINITHNNDKHTINVNSKNKQYNNKATKITITRKYNMINSTSNTSVNGSYGKIDSTFNDNLIFGASMNSNGVASSFYEGTIANIEVKVTEPQNKKKYELAGPVTFSGSNYIDTEVLLFSPENVNKDFEISFDVVSIDEYTNQATLMSTMNEEAKPWPGVVFRINTSQNKFEIRGGYNGNSSKYTAYPAENTTQNVKITRENKIIYYSIDGGTKVKIGDFSSVATFYYPVTFGAGLDEGKAPRRYFKGTLSNLKVEIKED